MAVFRKITDLRAGAAFLRFSRYTRRPFPVHGLFRTIEGGFWYRISLLYHRSLFWARRASENASRTVGSLFEHGTHIPYRRRPSTVRNAARHVEPGRVVNCFQIFYLCSSNTTWPLRHNFGQPLWKHLRRGASHASRLFCHHYLRPRHSFSIGEPHYFLKMICHSKYFCYLCTRNGVLAQLVERLNGIQKVRSSILLCSTRSRI